MAMVSSQKYSQKDSNKHLQTNHQPINTTSHATSLSNQIPSNDTSQKIHIPNQISSFQGTRGGSIDNLRTTKPIHQQFQSINHFKSESQNQISQDQLQQYHAQKSQQNYDYQRQIQDRQLNEKQLQLKQTSIAPSLNFKKLGPSDQQQQNFTVRFSNYRDQEQMNPSVNNIGHLQTKQTGRSVDHSSNQHDVIAQTSQSTIKTTAPSSHPETQIKYGGFNSTYTSTANLKFSERRASAAPIISQQSYGSQVLNNNSSNSMLNQQKNQFNTIQQQSDTEQSNNYYKTSNNFKTIQNKYGSGEIQNKSNNNQSNQDNYAKAQQQKNQQIQQKSPQNVNFSEKFVLNQILQRAQTSKQSSISPKSNNQGMISQFQKMLKNNGEQASSVSSSSTNTINASMLPIHKISNTQIHQNENQETNNAYRVIAPDNVSSKHSQYSINKKSQTFIASKQNNPDEKSQNDTKQRQNQHRLQPSNSESIDFYEKQMKNVNSSNALNNNQQHTQSQQIISNKSTVVPNSTKNQHPQTIQSTQVKVVSNQAPTPKSSSRPPMNIKQPPVIEQHQIRQTNSRQFQQQNIVSDTSNSQQQPGLLNRLSASQEKIDLKQVAQRQEAKNSTTNLENQNKSLLVKDLRKIRDESTQGSQSRAPNLSEINQLQQQKIQKNDNAQSKRGLSNDNSIIQQKGGNNSGQLQGRVSQQTNNSMIKKQQTQQLNNDMRRNSEQNGALQNLHKHENQQQNIFYNTLNQGPVKVSRGSSGSVNQINGLYRQNSQQYFSQISHNQNQENQLGPQNQTSIHQNYQNEQQNKQQNINQSQSQKLIINKDPIEKYKSQIDQDQKDLIELANTHPTFIGQTNLPVQQLFKLNQKLLTQQIKQDSISGSLQKIQQFTTLDINKMIHENSAEEENESQKLALQPGARIIIPNKEPTKCSIKRNGIVRAYSAITNQGLVRTYNEDRVSIILNITKPNHRKEETWPKCSFFGVYDGHGGHTCAEFLRDQLHHFVIKQDCFPQDPKEAIIKGFKNAEETFLQKCQARDESGNGDQNVIIDRSGSCAIVILIVGDMCYSANVGDSRAIMSIDGGNLVIPLSRDHKPSDINEYNRITKSGGQVYQTITSQIVEQDATKSTSKSRLLEQKQQQLHPKNLNQEPEYIIGPIRVLPGRLSVSRTFGDPEAKLAYRGGNINVVKAEPEIREFKIQKNFDFILLASDGVFDKMSNEDMTKCVWDSCDKNKWQTNPNYRPAQSVHQQCGLAVESVLKNSLYRQSLDNVTVVMIAFQNFKRKVFGQGKNSDREDNQNPQKSNVNIQQNKPEQEEKKVQEEIEMNQIINQKSRNEDQVLLQKRQDALTKNNANYKSQILRTQIQKDQIDNPNNSSSNQQNRFYQTQEVNQSLQKEEETMISNQNVKNKEHINSYRIIQANKQSQLQINESQDQQHSSNKPPQSQNQQNIKHQYQLSQKSISTLSQIKSSKGKVENSGLQINQEKKIRGASGSKITTPSSTMIPSSSQKTLVTNVSTSNQTTSTRAGSRQASQTFLKSSQTQALQTKDMDQNFLSNQLRIPEGLQNQQLSVPMSVKSSQIIQKNNEEQKRQSSQRSATRSINQQQTKQQSFYSNNQLTSSQSSYIMSKNSHMISQISQSNLNNSSQQKPSTSQKRNSSKGQLQSYINSMEKNQNQLGGKIQQQAQIIKNDGDDIIMNYNNQQIIKGNTDQILQKMEKIQQQPIKQQTLQQQRNSQYLQKDILTSSTPKQMDQPGDKNHAQVFPFIQHDSQQSQSLPNERVIQENKNRSPKQSQAQNTQQEGLVDKNQTQINLFFKEGLVINIQ